MSKLECIFHVDLFEYPCDYYDIVDLATSFIEILLK